MLRLLLWIALYILFLGVFSFRLKYKDGLQITLKGWPEIITDRR